jgi:allophanate hydrolase subunit 1
LHAQKAVQPDPGTPGAWQLIGRTQADHSVDHDTIFVRGPFDNFRRIKSTIVPARWNEGITVKRFEAIS